MKAWIERILGVKKVPDEPGLNATDDYVVVNRQHLENLLSELNMFRNEAALKSGHDHQAHQDVHRP